MRPHGENIEQHERKENKMYSPKIKENLIPILYKLAKQEQKPMTKLVNEMLRAEIAKRNGQIHQINNETVPVSVKKTADDGGS